MADTWPADGPPVLWTREIGAGFSGLIAHGGVVYTQAQSLTEQKVLAMDGDTGQTIWEHRYAWPYQAGGMFPGPRATPTWANDRIYFTSPNGLVGCLNAADGQSLWSVNVLERFEGRGAGFGYACSPVVEDGKVILPVGGPSASVVALDADTGAIRWTSGTAPASYCSALPISLRGRRQVVVFLQNILAGFDLHTGRLLWEQAYSRGFEEHAASVLYDEPYLREMQAYRAGSDLYGLKPGVSSETNGGVGGCTVRRVRHDPQMSNDIASSVLVNGFVYGFDLREMQASPGRPSRGAFRCVDFKTGEVRWSSDRPGQAGMVVADGKLLMLNDSGRALLVRADPGRYEELGRAEVFPGETCWTAPSLDGGRLYLRSPTRATCLFVGKSQRMSLRQQALAKPLAAVSKVAPRVPIWLIGAEREYPFELPDRRELTRWYLFSLGPLICAGLLAGVTQTLLRRRDGRRSRLSVVLVFWGMLAVFGVIATPLANRHGTQFVFTWPIALIAIHQIALAAITWSKQPSRGKSAEWVAIAGASLLVLACLFYVKFTRQLSLAPAWYFLISLPLAWPLAVPAARRFLRPVSVAGDILWMFAVFSVYFWATGAAMLLRTASL
ncbi:MAG TPA: PQQ-binding-like beta-propeller repeat protein [Tepidisphaeraceae bacterium]|nr:PQQ-binding-like beta-propeller repeat protein [Tepidisphaeraceae bacterium]